MKRIAVLSVCAAAVAGLGYQLYPDEFAQSILLAANATLRLWENIQANPAPVLFALGTFVLTVLYHKARGKSLRESVEVAATRVTVIPVPTREPEKPDKPVVLRARARATRAQLLVDQIGLQNRQRKLPDEIVKAEKEACYSQQALKDAEEALARKRKFHEDAAQKLEVLRKENAGCAAELVEIEAELNRLAEEI